MKTFLAVMLVAAFGTLAGTTMASATQQAGWKIPADAKELKNPLPVNDAMLTAGKAQYAKRCTRCHGPEGKGDGPEASSDHSEEMDLTRASRAAQNPDGVVFYKIWHGRGEPRMPAFEDQLTKEQAWAVVAYVQTLRVKK